MTDNNTEEKKEEKKSEKKQNFILRFFSWLAKGTEEDSKGSPFCST